MKDNMVSLYHMTEAMKKLENIVDMPDEEVQDYIDMLQLDIMNKGENILGFMRSLEVMNKGVDDEIKRLQEFKASRSRVVTALKKNVQRHLEETGTKKLDTPIGSFSLRKSESTEITDESLIPEKYMKEKVTMTPDKTAIKKAIKDGEQVSGAVIKHNNNLQIK